MIEVHAEFPQREVIQANAVVDNEEKTVSEVIISAKPEITGVTASVDNETGTPYVDITETGTGTEFSFDLAFHNLKGDKGEQGEQGEPGQDGQDGTDGTDGQDGFSPIATVEPIQDGAKITITDKDGTTSANLYNGADGQAATVTVGTTTTGAAGTNASVINSGTSSAAILDFTIPRGNTGATGVSVTGVSLISTQGLQKTYRMTFSNNTYYDYIVTDGASGSTDWGGITGTLSDQTDLQTELTGLQSQIDAIVSSSDVFDIVGTYAELQAYDISTVPVNDIIKVLVDSTHSNAATYYRCVETGGVKSWSYIGSEGAHYTKSETDTLLNGKYDATNPAGYTSNVGTVTSVNNTQPDANGNVTISVTGGANTDLSNLTATGEAHFQEPLVSGTNIKTINNNSILGSGNLTITAEPEIFVATYGTTTYQQVLDVYNAGKTILVKNNSTTDSLNYEIFATLSYIESDSFYFNVFFGRSPTNERIYKLSSTGWTTPQSAYGSVIFSRAGNQSVGNSSTPVYISSSGVATSTGLSIASSRFDGQWTQKYSSVASGVSAINTYSYSISSYLPDSTNAYEVYLQLYVNDNTTSSTNAYTQLANVSSPNTNISTARWFCQITSDKTSALQHICTVVNFKANERTIYAQISGRKLQTGFDILLFGYRRIGTNT